MQIIEVEVLAKNAFSGIFKVSKKAISIKP